MPQKISGIGVYARELFGALKKQNLDIEPVTRLSRILKSSAVEQHLGQSARPFWGTAESLKGRSIIQGPDFRLLSNSKRFAKIVTIHDLAVFHKGFNSESFREQGQKATRDVLYNGNPDVVIADTEVIANEIREHFPELRDRVKCIAPGSDHFLKAQRDIGRSSKKSPYFLYAGHLETRKNILGIVKGFEIVARENVGVRLVLVGKDGFQADDIRKYISESSAREFIDFRGFVTDGELHALYTSATAFVFPSFYEGFGFPILEAMSLGCPVITSNCGAMAELAGDAALLVDPHSPEHIADAMGRLLKDRSLVEQLMSAGDKRFRHFTWEKCAQTFVNLYKILS